jgi:hypothetical protein
MMLGAARRQQAGDLNASFKRLKADTSVAYRLHSLKQSSL